MTGSEAAKKSGEDVPDKARLRERGIRARDALTPEEREEYSARAAARIAESAVFQNAGTVLIYDHIRGELSLDALPAHPAARGKRFAYPLCIGKTEMAALVPHAWQTGPFGIREPDPRCSEPVRPEEFDLVICPCTVFDAACNRMGMGAGYYDRFLPKCEKAAVCAVAFEVQITDRVPMEPWDVPMDMIFTEMNIYYRKRSK